MNTNAVRRAVCVFLVLPCLAIGGCAAITGMSYDPAMGYGVGLDAVAAGDEIDPYTLAPFGMEPYGYDMGLDPYGYPVATWYGGYGSPYPGYAVGPAAVFPYAGASFGGAPLGGASASAPRIRPHPGPSPRRARGAALP